MAPVEVMHKKTAVQVSEIVRVFSSWTCAELKDTLSLLKNSTRSSQKFAKILQFLKVVNCVNLENYKISLNFRPNR